MQEPEQGQGQCEKELHAMATSLYSTHTPQTFAFCPLISDVLQGCLLIAKTQVLQAQRFQLFVLRETSERIQHPFP